VLCLLLVNLLSSQYAILYSHHDYSPRLYFQCALNGIIKGCGKQVITMPIVVIAYWLCAVPLGYYLAFERYNGGMCDDHYFCGVVALVTGATTGTVLHMLLLAVVVLCFTEWNEEVKKARNRVKISSPISNSKPVGIEMQSLDV